MKTLRTTIASMLMGLALVAFQFDAHAQARRTTTSTQSSSASNKQTSRPSGSSSVQSSGSSRQSSGSVSRQSSVSSRPSSSAVGRQSSGAVSNNSSSSVSKPSTVSATVSRPTGTARPASGSTSTKPSTTVQKPAVTGNRPSAVSNITTGSQTRPSAGQQTRPSNGSQTRPSTGSQTRPSAGPQTRPSNGSQTRPSTGAQNRPATGAVRPSNNDRPVQVTRPVDRRPGGEAGRPDVRPGGNGDRHNHQPNRPPVHVRPDNRPDPHRVHPRDRDFMHYSAPSYFWSGHNHCYGHRVRVLPTHVHRYIHHGVTYYCYNDIWYRPYGGHYVVCRPPFGTVLAANLIADMAWSAVRLSYYYTVANTYSQINENNRYITEQNMIIAQNNAVIAQQNSQIAAGQQQAQMAYTLATQLGLVQSYAAAGSEYYYQDGVFYVMGADGQYKVIVPPAGALVDSLPEDFDIVTLSDGNEYYKVDDTIYRVVVIEGKPYFEVLGQLYV